MKNTVLTAKDRTRGRTFDKSIKSHVLVLGRITDKLTVKDLNISHPLLVFEIFINKFKGFSIEIGIKDAFEKEKKMIFTSNVRNLLRNHFHSRIPNSSFIRGKWVSIAIDIQGYTNYCFISSVFKSVTSVSLSSYCKVKEVYSVAEREEINSNFERQFIAPKKLLNCTPTYNENRKISPRNFTIKKCFKMIEFEPTPEDEIVESIHISSSDEEHLFFPKDTPCVGEAAPSFYQAALRAIEHIRPFTPPFLRDRVNQ